MLLTPSYLTGRKIHFAFFGLIFVFWFFIDRSIFKFSVFSLFSFTFFLTGFVWALNLSLCYAIYFYLNYYFMCFIFINLREKAKHDENLNPLAAQKNMFNVVFVFIQHLNKQCKLKKDLDCFEKCVILIIFSSIFFGFFCLFWKQWHIIIMTRNNEKKIIKISFKCWNPAF